MASTGKKTWSGTDLTLYQELCGSRPKQRTPQPVEKREELNRKRPSLGRPGYAGCTMKGDFASRIASSPHCANVVGATTQNASVEPSWKKPSREDELSRECMRTVVV